MTEVVIPGSVESIGSYAFTNGLFTKITFNEGLLTIGESSFENTKIESVVLPNSFTTAEPKVFNNCYNLKNIVLGENLQSISANFLTNSNIEDGV